MLWRESLLVYNIESIMYPKHFIFLKIAVFYPKKSLIKLARKNKIENRVLFDFWKWQWQIIVSVWFFSQTERNWDAQSEDPEWDSWYTRSTVFRGNCDTVNLSRRGWKWRKHGKHPYLLISMSRKVTTVFFLSKIMALKYLNHRGIFTLIIQLLLWGRFGSRFVMYTKFYSENLQDIKMKTLGNHALCYRYNKSNQLFFKYIYPQWLIDLHAEYTQKLIEHKLIDIMWTYAHICNKKIKI